MKKKLFTLVALSALTFGLSSCTEVQNALNMPPGKYEKTVKSTDDKGTTTERNSSTEVEVDEYGNKSAVIKSKTTTDPEGLFNKTTTDKSKQVIESTPQRAY